MATPRRRTDDRTGDQTGDPDDVGSVFPGFREMSRSRRRLLDELVAHRRDVGLSQTEVAARMGTSQSAIARLEAQAVDLRLSTLERYAAALDRTIEWRVAQPPSPPSSRRADPRAGHHDQGGQP
jgi:ribosome-binding protein aMBF1 (putative translation factor)